MSNKKHCSFCGRNKDEVDLLLSGPEGCICNDCIERASLVLKDAGLYSNSSSDRNKKSNQPINLRDIPKPKEIKEYLDQYVIGQDDAKRYLSVAV